jgi:hypothetical protein
VITFPRAVTLTSEQRGAIPFVTRREGEEPAPANLSAVATWLLESAEHCRAAEQEWSSSGFALLRCGTLFTAVQAPLVLVEAVAGTDDRQELGIYLTRALLGGGVFISEGSQQVYFLVPVTAWRSWRVPETECFSSGHYLKVPRPGTQFGANSYWLVEMDSASTLCGPEAVSQLVMYARYRCAQNGG